jgi:hypothetical protein
MGKPPADSASTTAAVARETTATFASPDGRVSTFSLEIASTPGERARGLMHRKTLAADRGMVFVFPFPDDQTFYMKNTYVALDMIFVSTDRTVVGIVENARPLTLDLRSVGRPSQLVIELPAHTCRKVGIEEGSKVSFEPPLPVVRE